MEPARFLVPSQPLIDAAYIIIFLVVISKVRLSVSILKGMPNDVMCLQLDIAMDCALTCYGTDCVAQTSSVCDGLLEGIRLRL